MGQHLLLYRFGFKVVGPVESDRLAEAETFFRQRGFRVTRILPPPSERTLRRWEKAGRGKTTDNCWTNGLCSCHHGHRAWLAIKKEKMRT